MSKSSPMLKNLALITYMAPSLLPPHVPCTATVMDAVPRRWSFKASLQVRVPDRTVEEAEGSGVEQLPAGALQRAQCRPGQTSAEADPLDAEREERGRVDDVGQPGHDVQRAGDGLGEPADRALLDDAGHEDAVGSRFEVPARPLHRLGEHVTVRAGEVGVGAGVQHERAAGRGRTGGRDAVDGL